MVATLDPEKTEVVAVEIEGHEIERLYSIIPGRVKFNTFTTGMRVVNHDDCVVWEFDLDTKYAEVTSYMFSDEVIGVWVGTNDRTLHLDDNPNLPAWTYVEFKVPKIDGWWRCLAQVSRYTLTIVIWKDAR